MKTESGQVRVGSCHWEDGQRIDPSHDGFTPIICLTKSSEYGMLSPYCLTTPVRFDNDLQTYQCLVENYYQFSKLYKAVTASTQTRSRHDRTVIWRWPAATFVDDIPNVGPAMRMEYLDWRKTGMTSPEPIRYPVGYNNMNLCWCSIKQGPVGLESGRPLSYIEARKEIYLPVYVNALKEHPEFQKLKARLEAGENLLIIEVDCCQERSLPYYLETYSKSRPDIDWTTFIENGTMLVTKAKLDLLVNDAKERYGHGFCLAGALLEIY